MRQIQQQVGSKPRAIPTANAIALLRSALGESAGDRELHILLDGLLGGRNDAAKAIPILEQALERVASEKHGPILAVLAVSYHAASRTPDAIATCRRAVALEGLQVATAFTLARALAETGEHDEALELYAWLQPRMKPAAAAALKKEITERAPSRPRNPSSRFRSSNPIC